MFKQSRLRTQHFQRGPTVFTAAGAGDLATERRGHGLKSVADSEYRNALVEECGINLGSVVGIYARGPARQDDRGRLVRHQLRDGCGMRNHLGKNLGLSNPTRDQLRVLGTEVNNEYFLILRHGSNPTGSV